MLQNFRTVYIESISPTASSLESNAFVFVFDLTNRESFASLEVEFTEAKKQDTLSGGNFLLVGNCSDMLTSRCISFAQASVLPRETKG